METLHQYLELASFIITILGLPMAMFIYLREQRLLREEREYGTYDALDDKYIELQQLCLEYSDLDIFDTPFVKQRSLSEEQEKQEEAILLIRISIFERAFLMYQRASSKGKKDQWEGWDTEMKEWLDRKNFRTAWDNHGQYYDKAFVRYLNGYLSDKTFLNEQSD
ncbi:MAG: hypothetical protein GXO70_04505 [Acidobacteria bacterium]|nr:hypothetical protein [Acidobacteriota bacterium]